MCYILKLYRQEAKRQAKGSVGQPREGEEIQAGAPDLRRRSSNEHRGLPAGVAEAHKASPRQVS